MTTWKEASEDLKARVESNFKVHSRRYFEAFEEESRDYQEYTDQYNQAWVDFMNICAGEHQLDINVTYHLNTLNFKLTNAFPVLQNLLNTQPLFTLNYTAGYRQNDFNDWLDTAEIEDLDMSFKVWALGELSDAITRGIQDLVSRNLLQVAQADNNVQFWEELTKLYSVIGSFLAKVAEKALNATFEEEKPEEKLEPAEEIPEEVNDLVSSVKTPEETESPFEESKLREKYAAEGLDDKVKDWYVNGHGHMTAGQDLKDLTFRDLFMALGEGKEDIDDILGVRDTIVKEQVLVELAKRLHVDYKVVWALYVGGGVK